MCTKTMISGNPCEASIIWDESRFVRSTNENVKNVQQHLVTKHIALLLQEAVVNSRK